MIDERVIPSAFDELLRKARLISADVASEVDAVIRAGLEQPLNEGDATRLVRAVVEALRRGAQRRGDHITLTQIESDFDGLVARAMRAWNDPPAQNLSFGRHPQEIIVESHNGFNKRPVSPRPWFHGREVSMNCGWARTQDICLWEHNERLDIHVAQFRKAAGRSPSGTELLDIMLSKMPLQGISASDQFKIVDLARSIANNGVRQPPILDIDATLLDGNRRVAACYYILGSDEFSLDQKQRAEHIFVWQLTEHADEEDRRRVVVSLNFEHDYKEEWPAYVRAKKVYEDWQTILATEFPRPGPERAAKLKRELSMRYALGPDTTVVNRYLKMVEWAEDFEEYHRDLHGRDEFEVKHKTTEYFEYFDELSKGTKPGGVAHAIAQDDELKGLVFDLLFQDKFRNWRQIRALKYLPENHDALRAMREARDEPDPLIGQQRVEEALDLSVSSRAEVRMLGANERISNFVRWLEEIPVKAFRDTIRRENLNALLRALRLVERQVESILEESASD
jgi:hypothetical protein